MIFNQKTMDKHTDPGQTQKMPRVWKSNMTYKVKNLRIPNPERTKTNLDAESLS
jgi:hypothetical protein